MAYDVERDGPSNGGASSSGSSGLVSSAVIGPPTDSHVGNFVVRSSARDRDDDRVVNTYNKAMYDMMLAYNSSARKEAEAWEEKMSNTAIQRQVADMKAAGINPILAGRYGGASYNSISANYVNNFPTYDNSYGLAAYEASARSNQIHQQAEEQRETLAKQLSNDKELQELAYNYDLSKINLEAFNQRELQAMRNASAEAIANLNIKAQNESQAVDNQAKANLMQFQHDLDVSMYDYQLANPQASGIAGSIFNTGKRIGYDIGSLFS